MKGRGSISNDPSRYLAVKNLSVETDYADDWYQDPPATRVATQVYPDRTKKLITHNKSPDISFSQSINPYKGCEHGCIYCFARPTHAYLDLSPGLDFETKLFYKTDVQSHLRTELGKPGYRCSVIAIGTNTDPYQPIERQRRVMRQILQTLLALRHPVSIVTKSALILRDLDLLTELAGLDLVQVYLSVTTLDNSLKTKLEPRTAAPAARLRTLQTLATVGVPTGSMIAPIIPFINDHEIESLVQACADAGAQTSGYILLRLPLEVKELFEEWLTEHYPLKAQRVMAAIKDTRGGAAYSAQWHQRMVGEGPIAHLIQQRFKAALARAGLGDNQLTQLRTDLFTPPEKPGDSQLKLF